MRVEAEKGTNSCSPSSCSRRPKRSFASTTIERPSGRLVGERRELRGLGEVELVDAADGQELGRLAVAERDGSGLVEQEDVDVARGLDRAAGHREDVPLHEPVHPRDADRREQRADRRRDEGDEERDEDGLGQLGAGVDARTAAASPSRRGT